MGVTRLRAPLQEPFGQQLDQTANATGCVLQEPFWATAGPGTWHTYAMTGCIVYAVESTAGGVAYPRVFNLSRQDNSWTTRRELEWGT